MLTQCLWGLQLLLCGEWTSFYSSKVCWRVCCYLLYLISGSEIIPWLSSELVAKRKPKGASDGIEGAPTLLDQFVVTSKGIEDEVVLNEDGTMVAG
jgi:hypothetical protein